MPRRAVRRAHIGGIVPLALMPAAAFAVHQLRYWLAFGARAGAVLQASGHSYLHSLVPWIMLPVAIAVGVFLRVLGRALGGRCSLPRQTFSFAVLWLLCAGCLIAIYSFQEFLEGLLLTGHPGGLAGIFGYGGWWSIPAASGVGLVLASVFYGLHWVLREVARLCRRRVVRISRPRRSPGLPREVLPRRLAPMAEGWSGRGPPGCG
jgi:hypothetical protein